MPAGEQALSARSARGKLVRVLGALGEKHPGRGLRPLLCCGAVAHTRNIASVTAPAARDENEMQFGGGGGLLGLWVVADGAARSRGLLTMGGCTWGARARGAHATATSRG